MELHGKMLLLASENGEDDVLRHVLEMSRYCRGFVISVFYIAAIGNG